MTGGGRSLLAATAAALCLWAAGPARACGIELVLAVDVSRSVVNDEYDLQAGGMAAAFRDADVVAAIETIPGGVMATVTQWSGPDSQTQTIPWTHLTDTGSAARFADRIRDMHRAFFAAFTAVGEALVHAAAVAEANPNPCARRIIDIAGDGRSNRGRPPAPVADALAARGATINALVIRGARPDPEPFYRSEVVRGPGSFVEIANGFDDYARAFRAKLLRELSLQMAERKG